eukprot:TRINITY_DN12669_c0_g1_i2.p1 TRINITY_DN12669_c0_g1~~TRINITY_DN12669_c0_g1_i2.p1  ORF type:complete len:652 (-),score=190.53 TRINITY_DN12669_c0_g1_i2:132-1991(-)
MVAAATAAPRRPPTSIEEFLWQLHSVLVAAAQPLRIDQLKETYSKQAGHKFAIERFLVVGDGGLPATLKRIPHIVTVYQSGGANCVKATQPADSTKQDLVAADQEYRRELAKKNAQAKAKAPATAPAVRDTPLATSAKAPSPAVAADAAAEAGSKRSADANSAAGGDAKRAKAGGGGGGAEGGETDAETLARMLIQGVSRVLQQRAKNGKGALPLEELAPEFMALWKVPFNLRQVGETDPIVFLKKWPGKVEVQQEGNNYLLALPKKKDDKAKAEASPGPVSSPSDQAAPAAVPKKSGPSRPPVNIEDFLWNMHTLLEAKGPLPISQLKETYSKHLGHKCAVERFLVVGEGGLSATMRRIPHIVTVEQDGSGSDAIRATQPNGTTRDEILAVDQAYRKQLQQKQKASADATKAAGDGGAAAGAAAKAATGAGAAAAAAAEASPGSTPAAAKVEAKAAGTGAVPGFPEDQEAMGKMLIQGAVRVLQNRLRAGEPPLLVQDLEQHFTALWNVPFDVEQAGEPDVAAFLRKWPNKVEVVQESSGLIVRLAKKVAAKVLAAGGAGANGVAGGDASGSLLRIPAEVPSTLPGIRQYAMDTLRAMRELVARQEALTNALNKLPDA